jgi:anaerobic dimethyl sulfoxide reductase subunit A
MSLEEERAIPTICSTHCGGICLLKVHIKEGNIRRIEGDDGEEPQLRACLKGRAMRQRVYAPDRIKYPLKRSGNRGEEKFERISWDEALDTIATEMKRVKEAYGPASVLFVASGGDATMVHGGGTTMARLLSLFGGYTTTWGWSSWEGAMFASAATFGTTHVENARDDLLNSKLIILWGCDPATTAHGTNTMWYLIQAKESGTRIVLVDPRFSDTTDVIADQWVPIKPSTDAAMIIAMAYVIVQERLQDQEFLDRYTVGFHRFREYLMGKEDGVAKTPDWAEAITGVPAATIRNLAEEYGTIKPSALIAGIAPGRTFIGEQYHRAAITLAAMTGNIGIHGGNAAGRSFGENHPFNPYPFQPGPFMNIPPNPIDQNAADRKAILKNYAIWRSSARIHVSKLADAILEGRAGGYPADYKLLYVQNRNPVNQLPNTRKWEKALNRLEFMVVHEQFMTATARFADIVLPTTTFFERTDIVAGGSPPFYGYLKKIIDPHYEAKSQLQITTELAGRLGIAEYNDKTDEEWVKEIAKKSEIPDYDTFQEKAIHRIKLPEPYVPFKKQIEAPESHPFPTPSGKIEIYSEQLAAMNEPLLPPIPKYIEPLEGPNDPLVRKYSLQLVNKHVKRRAHSQLETLPWLREVEPHVLEMNGVDAYARGINDGDLVKVFNDRGVILIPVKVTERIMPGVVCMPQGAWYKPDENGVDIGGCASTLLRDEHSPCGAFVTNSCLVEVEKSG